MTDEKKMTNEEIAESCIAPSNEQRNIDIVFRKVLEALDEKDKEIARLRTQVNPLYQDLAGRLIWHIMENSDNHDIELALLEIINSAKKSRTEVLRLNELLERRTEALKNIVDNIETWSFEVIESEAHQALQDDGKEKI